MELDKQKVIKRLMKLINLSIDMGATEAERLNAKEKIDKISLKYNISSTEISSKQQDIITISVKGIREDAKRYTKDELIIFNLLSVIAGKLGVIVYVERTVIGGQERKQYNRKLILVGKQNNLDILDYVIEVLSNQISKLVEKYSLLHNLSSRSKKLRDYSGSAATSSGYKYVNGLNQYNKNAGNNSLIPLSEWQNDKEKALQFVEAKQNVNLKVNKKSQVGSDVNYDGHKDGLTTNVNSAINCSENKVNLIK